MKFINVNNSSESYTSVSSGAIATHIQHTSEEALRRGHKVVLLSREPVDAFLAPRVDLVISKTPDPTLTRRVIRKATGGRNVSQQDYLLKVLGALRYLDQECPIIFHNDPETASLVAFRFPRRSVCSLFHNDLELTFPWREIVRRSPVRNLAVSLWLARRIETRLGLNLKSVAVVHNGVDLDAFYPSGRQATSESIPCIVFLGRVGQEKGLDLLLRAALKLSAMGYSFELLIIGSNRWGERQMDDYQRELDDLITSLQESGVSVQRIGHAPRIRVPVLLRGAEIQVVPSRWEEPFALSLLEGMATGLAMVAADSGGMPEVLGDAGLLFARDDVQGLVAALRLLLSEASFRQALQVKSEQRARTMTWASTWEGLEYAMLSTTVQR